MRSGQARSAPVCRRTASCSFRRPTAKPCATWRKWISFIDLIVPRGGHALIEAVVRHARMPVIKHYHGVCIIYVDNDADLEMAERHRHQREDPSAPACATPWRPCSCIATSRRHFAKKAGRSLLEKEVEIRGDARVRELLGDQAAKPVSEEDWTTEYLDLILAARVVGSMEEAIAHIEKYGSHHSDAIITRDARRAEKFLNEVDSATVYWNASTRFTDGAEFGFGAEIGISTDKLHARGPMALEELTTYKYVIRGDGQIRE